MSRFEAVVERRGRWLVQRRIGPFRALRAVKRTLRNALKAASGQPDYKRWCSQEGLEEWWDDRTRSIAGLIPPHSHVIEFGAGRRQLERYLPAGCRYTPSDLVDRGGGTLVCDLNRRPLPDLRPVAPTVAVFGGVLEYTTDVYTLAAWLTSMGVETCIASFDAMPAASATVRLRERLRRWYFGYMCHLTETELLQAFETGLMTCAEKRTWTTQGIYRFVRTT